MLKPSYNNLLTKSRHDSNHPLHKNFLCDFYDQNKNALKADSLIHTLWNQYSSDSFEPVTLSEESLTVSLIRHGAHLAHNGIKQAPKCHDDIVLSPVVFMRNTA